MTIKTLQRTSMSVIMIGNRAHIVVYSHLEGEKFSHNSSEFAVETILNLVGR